MAWAARLNRDTEIHRGGGSPLDLSALPAKLVARIRIDEMTGCWCWVGFLGRDGYGQIKWPPTRSAKKRRAHRVAWELLKGPIPTSLTIDHLCRNRACVNPDHLEPVTNEENARRGGLNAKNRDWCRTGKHPWIPENIHIFASGERTCRRCREERKRKDVAAGKRRKVRPGCGQLSFFGGDR